MVVATGSGKVIDRRLAETMLGRAYNVFGRNRGRYARLWIFVSVMAVAFTVHADCSAGNAAKEPDQRSSAPQRMQDPSDVASDMYYTSTDDKDEIDSRSGRRRMTEEEREALKKELREAMEKAYGTDSQ